MIKYKKGDNEFLDFFRTQKINQVTSAFYKSFLQEFVFSGFVFVKDAGINTSILRINRFILKKM